METFDQRKILRYLSYVCLSVGPSVRPSVINTIVSEHKELHIKKCAHRLLLPIRWLVLKMGYIGPQDLVNWGLEHMERPIHTKFDVYDYMLTINVITKNDLD